MAFGSFDILHEGHKNYLQQAKSYGHLIVIVARDENIMRFKGRKPQHDENYRLSKIKELSFVDEAFLGNENDIFSVFSEYEPDVICLGYDQVTATEARIKTELEKRNLKAEIIRAKAFLPEKYKSSRLKKN